MSASRGPLVRALAESLKNAEISACDRAGVALARRYAHLLDAARDADAETEVFDDLGPKYLAVLSALGLTPAGRGVKGVQGGQRPGRKLDELRARREQRAREG